MKKLCSVLLLIAGSVSAADLPSQLQQCSKENDSLKRLMCFDQLALKASSEKTVEKSGLTSPVVEVEQPAKETVAEAEVVASAKTKATTTATPIAKEAIAAPSKSAQDIFGQESIRKMDVVNEVSFTIKKASLSLRKKWRFTFDNGQQWEQKDSDKFAKFKSGDEVTIKRGLMNAFYLKKKDANRTIRVKRLK